MPGVVAFGAYVPYYRLQRSAIGAVLGEGGGKGTRAVASYDEDATSMGVEAARHLRRSRPVAPAPQRVYFATASPPYLDKTNANVIHAALDLDPGVLTVDMMGGVRSGVGALLAAAEAPVPTLAVLSDLRSGLPGGADERDGGDGAAAFLLGPGDGSAPVLAEIIGFSSATDEFMDRWRVPGLDTSKVWEERFGEHVYGPLADAAFADALKQCSLAPTDVDHLIAAGLHSRAVKRFVGSCGVRPEALATDRAGEIGNAGVAQSGILLADVLERATPGQTIALAVLADGATVLVLRTTEALSDWQSSRSVAAQIAAGRDDLRYATFLSWRGQLTKEPPRRPDPDSVAAPPSHRANRYKFGFVGSRCEACATVHLPPVRVCIGCGAADRMADAPMAETGAKVATYTIDRLAFSPSPPVVAAVVDFDGGGRFKCQMTDVDPQAVAIGDRLEMTFRRLVTANGIHNYFWKARPAFAVPTTPQEG